MKKTLKPTEAVEVVKVLLIEDNPVDAELIELKLAESFEKLFFQRIDNAETLQNSLIEFDPDIILSDYSMPGFSGKEALSICMMLKPETPFIFVSGTIGEERAVEALKRGAVDYVLKSSLARLPHAVKSAIKSHKEKEERLKHQRELARTFNLLNTVFETTHMKVAYLDTHFNFIQANRAFSETFGTSSAEFIGQSFFDFFNKEEILRPIFEDVIKENHRYFAYAEEFIFNNKKVHLDWSVAPTQSFSGINGIVLTAVDITERIELEKQVNENQQRFYDAVNQAPDAVIIFDKEGEILFVNETTVRYFGYSHKEITKFSVTELISDTNFSNFLSQYNKKDKVSILRRSKAHDGRLLVESTAKRKNQTSFPVELSLGNISWKGENGIIAMIRDITDKKHREEELRQLSMVASRIDNAVLICDRNFNPKWVNQAFVKLMGFNLKSTQQIALQRLFSDENHIITVIGQMLEHLQKGTYVHEELKLTKKDGTPFWASIYATPFLDERGQVEQIVAIINDITERKNAEQERDELLQTLEERVQERTIELQRKNKNITDSINYARYIQDAFIKPLYPNEIKVNDTFIINLPKDVLSGDFHWHYHNSLLNISYVALADCTGHGVPGSLMTMLAVQLLEQQITALKEDKNPDIILSEIDKSIITFLGQKRATNMINDGMEIVLICIKHDKKEITFSGAGRDLYMHDHLGLKRFTSQKYSVGGLIKGLKKVFNTGFISYNHGDRLYAFSDGFSDQFGGPNKKKYSRRRKKSFLQEIQKHPFNKHELLLQQEFLSWKKGNQQIDDVIVMGIEL